MTSDADTKFPLLNEYNALARRNRIEIDIPKTITGNLSPKIALRPYQVQAVARFRDYMADDEARAVPVQLLFEMATGSGKTAVMAALMLDLYERGYRNFLFFVNSSQIVEKTKANFLDANASKFLFAHDVRLEGRRVDLRAVSNFEEAHPDAINIHFTTIQGLHARMQRPRENDMTPEDFEDNRVVLISDEAHHMSAETRAFDKLSKGDRDARLSWEGTVNRIMGQNPENILLEFTATADLDNPAIQAKYNNRLIYRYDLKGFRADGYSKDIELRRVDLPSHERMLQAVVLSQYRRKIAEGHGIRCKPVILMKSQKIAESKENENTFHETIAHLDGDKINKLCDASQADPTLAAAFDLVLEERGMDPADFAQELKLEFAPEKVINVNDPKDLEARQIQLNTLEDKNNEIRVIFAVDKLNEGWDVLNLFDIVRLYDKRDGKGDKVGKTTMSEAQLIGRGARYYPFAHPSDADLPLDRRKFDNDADNPLRVIEQLHYHCSHNPRYIDDIKKALRNVGLIDETARKVPLRLKASFKATEFYQTGHVWVNARVKNTRDDVHELADYMPDQMLEYPNLLSGRVVETGAFDDGAAIDTGGGRQGSRTFSLSDLGYDTVRFAMDGIPFFAFETLRDLFPGLENRQEFVTGSAFLSGVQITIRGREDRVANLVPRDRLDIVRFVLQKVETAIKSKRVDFQGTREFRPELIQSTIIDKTLKIGIVGEQGRSWADTELPGLDAINLADEDWHVFEDSYGTDQEKYLIRFIHDHRELLQGRFDEFYLIRNEKMVTLYAFESGRAFEPDFLLFLRRKGAAAVVTIQVFIEPKGGHLIKEDRWKQDFLAEIGPEFQLATLFQGKDYVVRGLPFFNSTTAGQSEFLADFEALAQI